MGNNLQRVAIQRVKRFLEDHRSKYEKAPQVVTEFTEDPAAGGEIWIKARIDIPSLPEGNLLRATSVESWLFLIGPRGAVIVKMCSRSCEQFDGKRAFGFFFDVKGG